MMPHAEGRRNKKLLAERNMRIWKCRDGFFLRFRSNGRRGEGMLIENEQHEPQMPL